MYFISVILHVYSRCEELIRGIAGTVLYGCFAERLLGSLQTLGQGWREAKWMETIFMERHQVFNQLRNRHETSIIYRIGSSHL